MGIDNESDRVRRIEGPILVLSLSAPLLKYDILSLSLATCEPSSLDRVDPWSTLKSEALK
jgi:hypothetical protein